MNGLRAVNIVLIKVEKIKKMQSNAKGLYWILKNKICPQISPNKTYEGLLGGFLMSVCTFLIIGKILEFTVFFTIIAGVGICVSSFLGDFSASWIKRKYGVKDFSSALPGQGGFLDRFDSFITAGAFVYLFHLIFTIV